MAKKSLYVSRPLLNGKEIQAWAKSQGFLEMVGPDELHTTIVYSKTPIDWNSFTLATRNLTILNGKREMQLFGNDKDTAVMTFTSKTFCNRWQKFCDLGCSWDYPDYHPHVTIAFNVAPDFDLDAVEPYAGPLKFGPEDASEIEKNWKDKIETTDLSD